MMMQTINIDGREIGPHCPPFVIAEMSANHNGDIDAAFEIIKQAKIAGADAVKIQTYRPDTITLDSNLPDFQILDGLWKGQTLYELYQSAYTPWEWHAPMFDLARELGITIFSSPFDSTAVDLLEDLNTPAYKIASFEAIDLPLIEYVARTKKPMIISTGMADDAEIQEAVDAARGAGCKELALLHCVSAYPAASTDYNLTTMVDMGARYNRLVGLSDHTIENTTAIAAVALGATIIEKHVTLDKKRGGPDDSFSIDFTELQSLVAQSKIAWEAKGHITYERQNGESENLKFRRSLYFCKDISKGEAITAAHIKSIRPGFGMAPKHYPSILGRKVTQDIALGTRVVWDLLDD